MRKLTPFNFTILFHMVNRDCLTPPSASRARVALVPITELLKVNTRPDVEFGVILGREKCSSRAKCLSRV